MGTSSKPLHFLVHPSLLGEQFTLLTEQGHTVEVLPDSEVDIILAPNAMRMTPDILKELPKALDLAIKGARTLRYGPTGSPDWKKGGKGGVQNKVKGKRKNSKVKAQAAPAGEPGTEQATPGPTGGEEVHVGTASHVEGDGQA